MGDGSTTACRCVALRAATPPDDDFVHSTYAGTRTEELADLPWTQEQKDAFLRMQSSAQLASYRRQWPDAVLQVVEVDGRPVGCLHVARTSGEIRVLDIALLPDSRGADIGGRLLGELQSEAELTRRPVRLHVVATNRALALYRRLGFTTTGDDGVRLALEWAPTDNRP